MGKKDTAAIIYEYRINNQRDSSFTTPMWSLY
jgi:hypothetical protein